MSPRPLGSMEGRRRKDMRRAFGTQAESGQEGEEGWVGGGSASKVRAMAAVIHIGPGARAVLLLRLAATVIAVLLPRGSGVEQGSGCHALGSRPVIPERPSKHIAHHCCKDQVLAAVPWPA